jgi:hypothetical protein
MSNNAVADFYRKQKYDEEVAMYRKSADIVLDRLNVYKRKKADYEIQLRKNKLLAGFSSCLDRMDGMYDSCVELMKKKSTEGEYNIYAGEFRALEGYKDSSILADECEKLAIKAKYERLVQEKNNAFSEYEYDGLVNEFRAMNGYENTAQLADECKKLAKKAKYEELVQRKNNASTEEEYENLAGELRAMNGYENSAQLADECDRQIRVLKERLAEQKRQEEARERKKVAEQQARESRIKNKRLAGLALQFVIILAWFLFGNRILFPIFFRGGFFIPSAVSSLILGIILGIISLIFRKDAKPKIPWGVVFLIISWISGARTLEGIITILILSAFIFLILFIGIKNYWGKWGYIGAIALYSAVVGIAGSILLPSTLAFGFSAVFAFPGMIMISKVERWLR